MESASWKEGVPLNNEQVRNACEKWLQTHIQTVEMLPHDGEAAPPKAPAAILFQRYFLKSRMDGMRHICIRCRTCRRPARSFIHGI